MKVLIVNNALHNFGGVERCVLNTASLLEKKGHQVLFFAIDHPENIKTRFSKYFVSKNKPFRELGFLDKMRVTIKYIYSFESKRKIGELIRNEQPDIVHIHAIDKGLTPSIIPEIKKEGIPIVMTLHGYALLCCGGFLFRNNQICEKCKSGQYFYGLLNRCFNNSVSRSFIAVLESYINIIFLNLYKNVDLFFSPSQFLIKQMKKMGLNLPIKLLPNFVSPLHSSISVEPKEEIIYFGRLYDHKGLLVLLDAVKGLNITLKIVGEGEFRPQLERYLLTNNITNVILLDKKDKNELEREIRSALFTILPSVWYENCPFTIIESFSLGKPVVASDIGGIPELIKSYETGILVKPCDSLDLRERILYLLSNRNEIKRMGANAKLWVNENLNEDDYYETLIKEYERLIKLSK